MSIFLGSSKSSAYVSAGLLGLEGEVGGLEVDLHVSGGLQLDGEEDALVVLSPLKSRSESPESWLDDRKRNEKGTAAVTGRARQQRLKGCAMKEGEVLSSRGDGRAMMRGARCYETVEW